VGAPGTSPGRAGTSGGGDGGPDLTDWTFWWEFNKDPYLNLKAKIHADPSATGIEGFWLGYGDTGARRDRYTPSDAQVRTEIVPALLEALSKETHNDIVSGALVALAKIGDAPGETGESRFEPVIARFLADKNQEIRETAAVALGILANGRSIAMLEHLAKNSPQGRALVGAGEVDPRTRAFATYGLGLIGSLTPREEERVHIVACLARMIEDETTRSRDLAVAGVIAMGLVPLSRIVPPALAEGKGECPAPESSRTAQLDTLLALLEDEERDHLVRAHCPTALARLLPGLPEETHALYRSRLAETLLARLAARSKEHPEVVQSAAQALGLIGTNDAADPLDARILAALAGDLRDASARNFAQIALAKVGARTARGARDPEGGMKRVVARLQESLTQGKGGTPAWAALACGVMARELSGREEHLATVDALQRGVRTALAEQGKDPSRLGAFAIAAGIMGDVEVKPRLIEELERQKDETALGYVAVGLGLLNAREVLEPLNRLVDGSKYRPELLKQTSIALGLMGDKDVVPKLVEQLENARGLATQAALARALGFIGDQRSIAPLVGMLASAEHKEGARGFAAVALGIVGDKESLPWNSKLALDLNYRASTATLTNPTSGTGILDIL
jgi:HEAT repeat protein